MPEPNRKECLQVQQDLEAVQRDQRGVGAAVVLLAAEQVLALGPQPADLLQGGALGVAARAPPDAHTAFPDLRRYLGGLEAVRAQGALQRADAAAEAEGPHGALAAVRADLLNEREVRPEVGQQAGQL